MGRRKAPRGLKGVQLRRVLPVLLIGLFCIYGLWFQHQVSVGTPRGDSTAQAPLRAQEAQDVAKDATFTELVQPPEDRQSEPSTTSVGVSPPLKASAPLAGEKVASQCKGTAGGATYVGDFTGDSAFTLQSTGDALESKEMTVSEALHSTPLHSTSEHGIGL